MHARRHHTCGRCEVRCGTYRTEGPGILLRFDSRPSKIRNRKDIEVIKAPCSVERIPLQDCADMCGGHHHSPPHPSVIRKLPHPITPLVSSPAQPKHSGGPPQTQCKQTKHFSAFHPRLLEGRVTSTEGRPQ